MRSAFPVVFVAYDLLEKDGDDLRARPLRERRNLLERELQAAAQRPLAEAAGAVCETLDLFEFGGMPRALSPLRISETLRPGSWEALAALRAGSRERQVEGIMLKQLDSAYGVGRQRGDWWKWKIDPLMLDAVLIQAQLGHGRRASLYTDYTFGLWDDGKLVPVAKAYSGLTDAEILEVDAFVRANTIEKFGPIRVVRPALVFELAFEAVQKSTRHKAGLAVRFPRMNRWRTDKNPTEADTLENLRALVRVPGNPG